MLKLSEAEIYSFCYTLWLPQQLSWQRILLQFWRPGFDPWVGKMPWRRERLPTPVFWPGESQGLYSSRGRKASGTTDQLSLSLLLYIQFSSIQSLSLVQLFATAQNAAHQASLSITNSQSLPKPMSIESVMPSNHLILCHPCLLLPSIFPSIRVFSNRS